MRARELDDRGKFDVSYAVKAARDLRWVLTWKLIYGRKNAQSRSATEGYRNPNWKDGLARAKHRELSRAKTPSVERKQTPTASRLATWEHGALSLGHTVRLRQ